MPSSASSRSPALSSTSLSSWVGAVKRAMDAKGLDTRALMLQAGLDEALLDDPLARYSSRKALVFWTLALKASDDPLLGLHTARYIAPSTFHALGYALLASSNLGELFERAERYFRVVTEAGELSFKREPDHGRLTLRGDPVLMCGEAIEVAWCVLDCFMLTTLKTCGMLLGPAFRLLELRLQRPPPARQRAEYERLFRATPIYGCEDNAILIADDVLRLPLPHGNAILARVNDEAAGRYLADVGRDDVLTRLKRLLQERLPSGDPSQDELAASLGLAPRSLQRRLAELGTSYRELINQIRHELALEYLAQTRYSVSDIAYLLGFAEVSAFTRAFKRWTGQSPSAWREGMAEAAR